MDERSLSLRDYSTHLVTGDAIGARSLQIRVCVASSHDRRVTARYRYLDEVVLVVGCRSKNRE